MKRILITLTALFVLAMSAQAEEETFITSDVSIGAFAGPGIYYTDYMGEATAMIGGQVGVTLDKTIYVGVAGYGFGRRPEAGMAFIDNRWCETRYEGGYGGFLLGATLYSDRVVHGGADLMVGGGAITRVEDDGYWNDADEMENDGFFVMQPMVHAELNVIRWMRLDIGAGYRFATGVDRFGLENEDVSGPVAGLGFRFGKF